ncbi:MAG: hypothetical protein ACLRY5_11410 [Zhenhengia sp.]
MNSEKKIMRVVTGGTLIGSLIGYFLALPYVIVCGLVCFAISGVGMVVSEID